MLSADSLFFSNDSVLSVQTKAYAGSFCIGI